LIGGGRSTSLPLRPAIRQKSAQGGVCLIVGSIKVPLGGHLQQFQIVYTHGASA
jgi:hypothetical protein